MTRRISLTLDPDELERLVRLRNLLDPGMPLASFASNALSGAVEAELHGIECQCHHMAQVLYNWQPAGPPN